MTTGQMLIKQLKSRALSTSLTLLSVALGVALVAAISIIRVETKRNFSQTSVGYDVIIAAKGSQMQATLNTLYHLESSTGVIPYGVYETAMKDARVEHAFPIYVGDNFRGFRVIGTSYDYLEKAEPRKGQQFQIAQGRVFKGLFEAVIGADVAKSGRIKLGDVITLTHGVQENVPGEKKEHDDHPVKVVGVLKPSFTANDRAIFTSYKTTHAFHDPNAPTAHDVHDHGDEDDHDDDHWHDADIEVKELDALLIKMKNPAVALQLAGLMNYPTPASPIMAMQARRDPFFPYKPQLMAVIPAMQIKNLVNIIGNVDVILEWIAWLVVVVALMGIMVALYNSMDARKREIAIMRALGASQLAIMRLIVLEAVLISSLGAVLGLVLAHGVAGIVSPLLSAQLGVVINPLAVQSTEWIVLGLVIVAGALAGIVPARRAYEVDVTANL